MRPLLHPSLVNGRSGDPALYIETLFEQRAILFDLGDITALSPRKVQRSAGGLFLFYPPFVGDPRPSSPSSPVVRILVDSGNCSTRGFFPEGR
jgi:hypothetical protein